MIMKPQDIVNLTVLYSAPGRHYHNLDHINWCLAELEQCSTHFGLSADEIEILKIAIWWHDAVYNPYSKLNEVNSANLFHKNCTDNFIDRMNKPKMHAIMDMILLTARHTSCLSLSNQLEQILLDIDLASLGYDHTTFLRNNGNIRKEYYFVDQETYCKASISFLQTMLEKKRIYYTDYFYDKYEQQARSNMEWQVSFLKDALNDIAALKVNNT